jgi:DNA invertase Pin-like site-specific DNA recombinase
LLRLNTPLRHIPALVVGVCPTVQNSQLLHKPKARLNQQLRLCGTQVRIGGPINDCWIRKSIDAGCERVFAEKQSGAKTDRQQLAKAFAALTAGGTLVVCKLDRLARSTRDLLNTLDAIAEAGATFKSPGDPWCDTTTPHGRLMLTVLGGLAEFERHLILARTSEGRQRAQQRGVRFGRKPKLTAHQQQEALARRSAGEALVDIARTYNVSHSTISRL